MLAWQARMLLPNVYGLKSEIGVIMWLSILQTGEVLIFFLIF